ncbi:MAG TPA: hypothetical protein VFQ35_21965 [Polyangiaceae bacterium]|nr:hypothetical protein [Polyangiaceae bacterium]
MSRLRIELVGARNHKPLITVFKRVSDKNEQKSQSVDPVLETDVGSDDLRIVVEFSIPKEILSAQKKPQAMAAFAQNLNFVPGSGVQPASHQPAGSNAGPKLHPRFLPVQGTGASAGSGALIHYRVDCRFLPMTELLRSLDNKALDTLDSTVPDPLRPSGAEVRVYECTVGTPRFWVVAFAPGAAPPAVTNLHPVVFFMPKSPTHSNLTDLSLFSVRRYLLSAPKNHPFFVRCFQPNDPLTDADWPSTVTNAALLEQVVQSGKPILLALPVPSGSSIVPSGGNIRELMTALRRAVHGDDLGKAEELQPAFRVGVSGFSHGADTAADLLSKQPGSVDEFYWMDPGTDGMSKSSAVEAWVQGNATRRLRLIGTTINAFMHALANRLAALGARVNAMPPPDFRKSDIYRAAVGVPIHTTSIPFPETFQDAANPAAPPPGSLSDATGIFVVSDSRSGTSPALTLQVRDLTNKPIPSDGVQAAPFTVEEIAGKARFGMLNVDRKSPPPGVTPFGERLHGPKNRTLRDFIARFAVGEILDNNNVGDGSIHQWAAVGGLGGGGSSPRQGFTGFFQSALERGDFPK